MHEVNPAPQYRSNTIFRLKRLAEFNHPKSFKDMKREDIINYLDSLRKPESVDPLHKWKGNHELTRIVFNRFFRWLYYPDVSPHSKRPKPEVMASIGKIKRMEEETYKPTDLWTEEDDMLFYKYCPSLRDKCWHAVARDTGCRPHEMLKLKIKDIVVQHYEDGKQIAKIQVNGKTGVRNVRIYNGYPRLKDWLTSGHPYPGNPNAPLFCGVGKKNTGRRLAAHTIYTSYMDYQKVKFPKILQEDPLIPEEEKRKIRELLKKPWNPYIRRHTSATEVSKAIQDPIKIDKYFGWKHKGNTRQKYLHYYSDDGIDAVLEKMDGLVIAGSNKNKKSLLKPKSCPNCDEPNNIESKFCSKCKFVLSFDAFSELEQEKTAEAAKEAENLKKQLADLQKQQQKNAKKKPGST